MGCSPALGVWAIAAEEIIADAQTVESQKARTVSPLLFGGRPIPGGAEAAITKMGLSAFQNMKALSDRNDAPEKASRPFDAGFGRLHIRLGLSPGPLVEQLRIAGLDRR